MRATPLPRSATCPALLLLGMLGLACRSGGCGRDTPADPPRGAAPPPAAARTFGGNRPASVFASDGAAQGVLLALHGYGDAGTNFALALDLPALARHEGFVLVAPDGTPDARDHRFWNATDACCNFFATPVDDVAYLRGLLAEVGAAFRVDPRRRYVLGLSNGAFMAYRLACEAADDIAAIVAIAGTTASDPAGCRPQSPVSILHVHGDADRIIDYAGGSHVLGIGRGEYPGAVATVLRWAGLDACTGRRVAVPPLLDLDRALGPETAVEQVAGCPKGVDVRLFTLRGAPHLPAFAPAFGEWVSAWLKAHPKVAVTSRTSGRD